jgi:hypothetical protein
MCGGHVLIRVDRTLLDPPPKAEAPSTGAEAMQVEGSTPPFGLEPDWRVSYLDYLTRGDLPSDKTEARQIARRAKTFVIIGDSRELYRRSPTGVLQRCITNKQGRDLLSYTRGLAVTTQRLEPSSETPSDKDSTGRPRSPMPSS